MFHLIFQHHQYTLYVQNDIINIRFMCIDRVEIGDKRETELPLIIGLLTSHFLQIGYWELYYLRGRLLW